MFQHPKKILSQLLGEILPDQSPEALYHLLEKPPESHLGDYALPCFRLGKNPKEAAQDLVLKLTSRVHPLIREAKAVGAFCNIFLNTPELAHILIPRILDESYFVHAPKTQKTMVEFSQPNTHKEFHIGHGRNVCLGDSLGRLMAYEGYPLIRANYLGDEGTHVAKCLWQVAKSGEPLPQTRHGSWYGQKYIQAAQFFKDLPAGAQEFQELSEILMEIEKKSGPFYDLWLESRQGCLADFDQIYRWLDVTFDEVFFESQVSQESQAIVDEYIDKGLFTLSEGAYGVSLEPWKLGFFMARKSDGTGLYITKDLALARRKFRDFAIAQSIYVVGSEQNFHFKQLFKVLELMGFPEAAQCHHLSYAHVKLPSGKMSSRSGAVVSFAELRGMVEEKLSPYLEKYKGTWPASQIEETQRHLTVAAIRYGMLATDPQKEIVFDPEAWTNFEGNSGLYLMYVFSRTASILRKAKDLGHVYEEANIPQLTNPVEHELLSSLGDFSPTVSQAVLQYKPSLLCHYLYDLAKNFNRFYAQASVVNAQTKELASARLALVQGVSLVLGRGLNLLGITPVDHM